MNKPILVDVMLGGKFVCQLKYTKRGFPRIFADGEVIESVSQDDLRAFVEEKRPSLKGKDYKVAFSNQRVLYNK